MLRLKFLEAGLVAAVVSFSASSGYADEFSAKLSGFNEIGSIPTSVTVPAGAIPSVPNPALTVTTTYTGAVLSNGSGTVTLDLDRNAGTIAYTLKYQNVGVTPPKTGSVLFAHIHFGKSRDSGGILVYFCTNLPFTSAGHTGPTPPTCPSNSGTVTGTWSAANVQAILTQNVAVGDFNALVDALNSNTAYANVHTMPLPGAAAGITAFPAGEIRGQCHSENREHRDN